MKRNFLPLHTANPLINSPEQNSVLATSSFSFQVSAQLNKTASVVNKAHPVYLWVMASSQYFVRIHAKGLNSNQITDLGKAAGVQTGDLHQLGSVLAIIPHFVDTKKPIFHTINFEPRALLPVLDPAKVEHERKKLKMQYNVINEQEYMPLNEGMQKDIVIRFLVTDVPSPNANRICCCDISLFDLLQTAKSSVERGLNTSIKDSVAQLSQSLSRGTTSFQNALRTWPLTKKLDPTSAKSGILFVHSTTHHHVPTFEKIMQKHTVVFRPMVIIDLLNKHPYAIRENSPQPSFTRDLQLLNTVMSKFVDQCCYVPRTIHPSQYVQDLLQPVYDKHQEATLPILQEQPSLKSENPFALTPTPLSPSASTTSLETLGAISSCSSSHDEAIGTTLISPLQQLAHNPTFINQHFARYPLSQGANMFQSVQPSGIPLFFSHATVPHTHIPPSIHSTFETIVGEHKEIIPNLHRTGHPDLFKATTHLCSGILTNHEIVSPGVDPKFMQPSRPILDPFSTSQHGLMYDCYHYDVRHWLYGEFNNHVEHLKTMGVSSEEIAAIPPPVDFAPDLPSLLQIIQCAMQIIQPSEQEPTTIVDTDLMFGFDEEGNHNIPPSYYHGLNMAHFLGEEVLYRTLMQMKDDIETGVIQYYVCFMLSYKVDCLLNDILPSLLSALPLSIVLISSDMRDSKSSDYLNIYRIDPEWQRLDLNLNGTFSVKSGSPGAIADSKAGGTASQQGDISMAGSGKAVLSTAHSSGYKRQQKLLDGGLYPEPIHDIHAHVVSKIVGNSAYLSCELQEQIDSSIDPSKIYITEVKDIGLTNLPTQNSLNLHGSSSNIFSTSFITGGTNNILDSNNNTLDDDSTSLSLSQSKVKYKKEKKDRNDEDDHEDITSYQKKVQEEKCSLFRTTAFRDSEDNLYSGLIKQSQGAHRNMFVLYIDSYCFEGAKQKLGHLTADQFEEMKQKEISDYLQQRIALHVKDWFNLHYKVVDLYQQYTSLSTAYREQFAPPRAQLQQHHAYQRSLIEVNSTLTQAYPVALHSKPSFAQMPSTFQRNPSPMTPTTLNQSFSSNTNNCNFQQSQSINAHNPLAANPSIATVEGSGSFKGLPVISLADLQRKKQNNSSLQSTDISNNPSNTSTVSNNTSSRNPASLSSPDGGEKKEKKSSLFNRAKLLSLKKEVSSEVNSAITTTATAQIEPHTPSRFNFSQNDNDNDNNDTHQALFCTSVTGAKLNGCNTTHHQITPKYTSVMDGYNSDSASIYSDEEDDSDSSSSSSHITSHTKINSTNTVNTPQKELLTSIIPSTVTPNPSTNTPVMSPTLSTRPPIPLRLPPPLPPKLHPITQRLDVALLSPEHIHCGFDNSYLSQTVKSAYPNRICSSCQTSDHSLYNYHTLLWNRAAEKTRDLHTRDEKAFSEWIQRKQMEHQMMQQQ